MKLQLDDTLHRRITEHTDRGNEYCRTDALAQAIEEYKKALALIPEPLEDWEASTWVLVAVGDCYFLLDDFRQAHTYLSRAIHCPGALGNFFIHLRLGQVQLELGNQKRAKDELARAYMAGGEEAFQDEDPKYFNFIRRFMKGL